MLKVRMQQFRDWLYAMKYSQGKINFALQKISENSDLTLTETKNLVTTSFDAKC